jgi:hypothetical protein
MSVLLPRFLRSLYRQEPVSGILITMGLADIALGGVSGHGSLSLFGAVVFGLALGAKWLQSQRQQDILAEQQTVQHYLPAQSSQQELPMLSINKKRPPSD